MARNPPTRISGMRRFLIMSLWCLLPAAVVSILVAWGCAMWCRPGSATRQFVVSRPSETSLSPDEHWTWNRRTGLGVQWLWIQSGVFRTDPPDPRIEPPRWVELPRDTAQRTGYLASGWPLACMVARQADAVQQFQSVRMSASSAWQDAYVIRGAPNDPYAVRLLPLRPHVTGLLGDTAFWAMGLASLFWIVAHVRGRFRHELGHCRKCNYNLRGVTSEKCPECGAVVDSPTPDQPAPCRPGEDRAC